MARGARVDDRGKVLGKVVGKAEVVFPNCKRKFDCRPPKLRRVK
jgi:hypothetical protein